MAQNEADAKAGGGGSDSGAAARQAASDAQNRSKSKQGPGRKGRGGKGSAHQTEVVVGDAHVDMVRLVRTERKAEYAEDDGPVMLSKSGKAQQLTLSEDHLSVTGAKGFRSVRCTHGVHRGSWYCEFTISHLGATGHVRLGWGTKKAELQAPVGFDEHGFAFRDVEGSKVHQGRREAYGTTDFKEGDVVGMLLHMPEGGRAIEVRKRKVVKFKGAHYYEEEPEVSPKPLPGSKLMFSVNGVDQGVAFSDIPEGTYYPMVSLYTMPEQLEGASVAANFGPDFKFGPLSVEGLPPVRAMHEATAELAAEKVAAEREDGVEKAAAGEDKANTCAAPPAATST